MKAKFSIIETRDNRIKALENELEESNEARRSLKYDIEELNEKVIVFEEELFESKTIQLDLLDQLKLAEDKVSLAEEKIDELLKLNEELEKN